MDKGIKITRKAISKAGRRSASDSVVFFGRSINDGKRCEAAKNKVLSVQPSRKFAKATASTAKIYMHLLRKNYFSMGK